MGGYGIVLTTDRVVGSRKNPLIDYCSTYLGPNSRATDEERAKATKIAGGLIENKEFELQKNSILKLLYRAPGIFSRGHITFNATSGDIELLISNLQSGSLVYTLKGLLPSLVAFAPERLYDEKTGVLVRTIIANTGKFPK